MSENIQKVNNVSIAHILKILTQSMKARKYPEQEIAMIQKEFLEQFDIKLSDSFVKAQDVEVSDERKTVDFLKIENWLSGTDNNRICAIMVWREALQKRGKPSKDQSAKIGRIIDEFEEWERLSTPAKFKEYGSQRGWGRKEELH